jgi:hypothetical protein
MRSTILKNMSQSHKMVTHNLRTIFREKKNEEVDTTK